MTTKTAEHPVNAARRDFLKAGGALVVTFSIGAAATQAMGQPAPGKSVAADQVDGFLAIDAKGRVTVYSGKVDLGTGIQTAMAQIAAEELSVPLAPARFPLQPSPARRSSRSKDWARRRSRIRCKRRSSTSRPCSAATASTG